MKKILITMAAATAVMAAGCSESSDTDPKSGGADNQRSSATSAWLLASAPGEGTPVGEVKSGAKEGDTVTVIGRIGGRIDPITPTSPTFLIVDPALKDCSQLPGDNCPTPWDYCCEPPDSLKAHSATVMLVGADGTALDVDPIEAGLSPSDTVVVVGTVGPRPSPDVLTIRATGVHKQAG